MLLSMLLCYTAEHKLEADVTWSLLQCAMTVVVMPGCTWPMRHYTNHHSFYIALCPAGACRTCAADGS